MDKLSDILEQHSPSAPSEIDAIKKYITLHFHAPSHVAIQNGNLIISVQSAALASTLRMRLPQLQSAARTKRRLILRIGY